MTPPAATTRWSLVRQAKGDTPQARVALAELCQVYYVPVLAFVKRWCREAEDMTQAFFTRVLEGGYLEGADAARGRFRTYLFGAVKHFIFEQHRRDQTQKRGGDAVPLDGDSLPELPDARQATPDAAFDKAWACALLDQVLALLRDEMQAAGKGHVFEALKPALAGDALHGDNAIFAVQLGVSPTAVRVLVSRLRQRLRDLIRQELAQTLAEGADVEAELRHLAEALRQPG